MKKLTKLGIKKITLRNLDEPALAMVAGGITGTCYETCPHTCIPGCTPTSLTCAGHNTCK